MIRQAVKTVSATTVLALAAAAPAVACKNPTSASNPQGQPRSQAPQQSSQSQQGGNCDH